MKGKNQMFTPADRLTLQRLAAQLGIDNWNYPGDLNSFGDDDRRLLNAIATANGVQQSPQA
jgi:hypothetical protein